MYAVLPEVFEKIRAIFVWLWKLVSVSARYLFYQPMDEKIKTCTLGFPAKENFNMEKASRFDWSIVSQNDVKAKYRLISRKFLGRMFFHASVRLTNQKPRAFVSVRQTDQIAVFSFVCCFCLVRAFLFQGHTKIALMPCSHYTGQLLRRQENHTGARRITSRSEGEN